METCANCGATIGNLETPYLWREKIVCAACHGKLAGVVVSTVSAAAPPEPAKPAAANSGCGTCPACHSTDIASLKMVHERGFSQSNTAAVGFGGIDELIVGSTSSQSALSARAAPPAKKSEFCPMMAAAFFVMSIGVFICAVVIWLKPPSDYEGPDAISIAVVGVFGVILAAIFWGAGQANVGYNEREWAAEYRKWEAMWMCMRCGEKFKRG